MKRVIATVGLGFGDEGKGATVDYLARRYEADLIVRYCGGCQAGHNVQRTDGRRHTFSQFGAGTLAPGRPHTYLGPNMIIDPLALVREAQHLGELGVEDPFSLLTIHPHSLVATPWHRILNQLRELSRGDRKHGSCGQGVGEARAYWLKHGNDAVFAADLTDIRVLRSKLELQRQRTLLELQELVERIPGEELDKMPLWDLSAEVVARDLNEAVAPGITFDDEVPECQTAIFEGAQGVLLDEYRGFHPHTTWNTVTTHHAWELIDQMDADAVSVLGITRAYMTRHGEGPLPTFSPDLTKQLADPGNPWNPWQGSIRCGWLDLPLLRYAAKAVGRLDGLVVNHLDQVRNGPVFVCDEYRNAALSHSVAPDLAHQARLAEQIRQADAVLTPADPEKVLERLNEIAPVVLTSSGPSHHERACADLTFRKRRRKTTGVGSFRERANGCKVQA